MARLREKLWIWTSVGGMARYENDPYQRVSEELPGNPWFICTLWLADYYLERAIGEVSPLTWSHATYVTTVHRMLRRLAEKRTLGEGQEAHPFYLPTQTGSPASIPRHVTRSTTAVRFNVSNPASEC